MTVCARPDCQRLKQPGRIWCAEHGKPVVQPIAPLGADQTCFSRTARRCEKIRQNDEWFCGKCHRRWGVEDDPPADYAKPEV